MTNFNQRYFIVLAVKRASDLIVKHGHYLFQYKMNLKNIKSCWVAIKIKLSVAPSIVT